MSRRTDYLQRRPIQVVVGEEVHVSLLKALSMLGLGRSRVTRVPADSQGRMRPEALPTLDDRTVVCVQAGNVNSGAFDPAGEICARAQETGSWVHVDGAFGCWAAASPQYAPLLSGAGAADSWAIDCHKWLNVPYDSAVAVVRHPEHLKSCHGGERRLPYTGSGPRAVAVRAGSVAARTRGRDVGGHAVPGTQRARRTDRAKLPSGEVVCAIVCARRASAS